MKNKKNITFDSENLAFPEIRIHNKEEKASLADKKEADDKKKKLNVDIEDLAVPEIYISPDDEKRKVKGNQ